MTAKQRAHVESLDEPDFFAAEVVKPLWFLVHEAEARELLMGRVPEDVREQARCALDWQWDSLRRGERPIVPSQKAPR
jgi:hypothetical protein